MMKTASFLSNKQIKKGHLLFMSQTTPALRAYSFEETESLLCYRGARGKEEFVSR